MNEGTRRMASTRSTRTGKKLDEQTMEEDNRNAIAAAARDIEAERKAHKCYIFGRRDLTCHARRFGWVTAGLLAVFFSSNAALFGIIGALALGATFGAFVHESEKPDDEQELRQMVSG